MPGCANGSRKRSLRCARRVAELIGWTAKPDLPVIEAAAACAMLHSFYTKVEKILKMIALDLDQEVSPSESWHRDLLNQMTRATASRPAVITPELRTSLGELLAFRHLFRGASIAIMRWNKLAPLVAKVPTAHQETVSQLQKFRHARCARSRILTNEFACSKMPGYLWNPA